MSILANTHVCIYGATFQPLDVDKDILLVEPESEGDRVLLTREDLVRMLSVIEGREPQLAQGEVIPDDYVVHVCGLKRDRIIDPVLDL